MNIWTVGVNLKKLKLWRSFRMDIRKLYLRARRPAKIIPL